MKPETILSLDISTKTGWSVVTSSDKGLELVHFGQISKIERPDESYPGSFVSWAYLCYEAIYKIMEEYQPDSLVIEETAANSKSSHSQKILEFVHFLIAKFIKETNIKSTYLMTGQWRKEAASSMNDDEKKHNKEVLKYKKTNKTKIAYDINGKRVGKITKKHVAIRRANEVFGKYFDKPLRKKDEDLADSLCLSIAYHNMRLRGLYE